MTARQRRAALADKERLLAGMMAARDERRAGVRALTVEMQRMSQEIEAAPVDFAVEVRRGSTSCDDGVVEDTFEDEDTLAHHIETLLARTATAR